VINSFKNKDLPEISSPGMRLGAYGLTTQELNDIRLDLSIVDNIYDKWAQEDDSLSGVLNTKLTKQKNADFRLKLDAWKNRETERKKLKKTWFEHGKGLRKCYEESKRLFNMDKNLLLECIDKYNVFCDDNAK
jgi:predicted CopG family antitoxin